MLFLTNVNTIVPYNFRNVKTPAYGILNRKGVVPKATTTIGLIFSEGQEELLEILRKEMKDHILFESPKAVNIGHGKEPRNTLVLFTPKPEWLE